MKVCSTNFYISAPAIVVAFFTFGCAATFLVSKDCKTYFFGSNGEGLYRLLCQTGDFRNVLAETGFPDDLKERFYASQCVERSYGKVKALYLSLAPEQQRQLRFAFQKQGYEINFMPTDNYQFDYYDSESPEFCPPGG